MLDAVHRNKYVQGMSNVRTALTGEAESEAGGDGESLVRIGELARRAGIPAGTLRAWERRYGVLSPRRGDSGYRLYSAEDERTLRSMVGLIEDGLAPAEAANRVRSAPPGDEIPLDLGPMAQASREELAAALKEFDGESADRVIDRAIASFSVEAFLSELALPVLREIGDRWASGEADIGEEHFASSLLRGRLLGLARGWGGGTGRRVVLACPAGERHDLGLVCFGLALRANGWRVTFLGADTPADAILACVEKKSPALLVLFAMESTWFELMEDGLAELASMTQVRLAGGGTDADLCDRTGALPLEGDPVEAAAAAMALA